MLNGDSVSTRDKNAACFQRYTDVLEENEEEAIRKLAELNLKEWVQFRLPFAPFPKERFDS